MKRLRELRQKRGELVEQMRGVLDRAEQEKRELTAEEQAKYDTLFAEQKRVADDCEREERQVELERTMLEQRVADGGTRETASASAGAGGDDPYRSHKRGTPEYRAAFERFLRFGRAELSETERRALQADADTQGGYLVAPMQFIDGLIKNVDDLVFIRQLATKERVETAQALGVGTLEADPADADWTSELGTGTEDSTMSFGRREWRPHPLAKRIKVSNDLLRRTSGSAATLAQARLAYKFAISQEKAFLLGTGAQQPLGLFVANANGVPTSRDVDTGSSTSITMDGLINAKYSLKAPYWNAQTTGWLLHRDAVKIIAKLKDGQNQYLWQPSVQAGQPDRLLSFPIYMSEYVPNTFTTGQYVGMLADFSQYWIADAMDMTFRRLDELYAESNQTGFIGRLATDGQPVLPEAFARLKTS